MDKKSIYNAIQNLYNMDFKTWQEVIAMLYNLVADVDQKFEVFESKFEIALGAEVTFTIKEMVKNGTLNQIINAELLNGINNKVNEINNKVDEFKDDIHEQLDNMENIKANIGQVKEEIAKAKLEGAGIDTSNFLVNSDLSSFDNGKLNVKISADLWEHGFINASGQLVDDNVHLRTKDFILFDTSAEYTIFCLNGNGCIFRFYEDDGTFKQSINVTATDSITSRIFNPPSKKAKIVLNYYSSDFHISIDNFILKKQSNMQSEINNILGNIENIFEDSVLYRKNDITDFDELKSGSCWISINKSQSLTTPLINAPEDMRWGNFAVATFKVLSNYYLQLVITSTNEKGKYGAYIRLYTKGNNVIRWSDLDVRFLKSQDTYVAFGDSITHGYLKTENGQSVLTTYQYWKTVGNILKLNASEGANTGSGFVFVQGNKNALRIIEEYDFTNVNLATFAFGTNDWNGNIPLGTINDKAINGNVNANGTYINTTNTIYSAIKYCVEKALSQNPKMTLILITPINRSQAGNSGATLTKNNNWGYGATNKAGYTLGDVCQAIVDVAKYYGIRYIDNREGCPINRLNVQRLTTDGLHPDDWGYMKLGQYYTGQISAIYRPYQK